MKTKLFSYSQLDTFIHRLSGLTKLICFLFLTTSVMLTFDIRIILGIMVLSLILFKVAKIEFKKVRLMFIQMYNLMLNLNLCLYLSCDQFLFDLSFLTNVWR